MVIISFSKSLILVVLAIASARSVIDNLGTQRQGAQLQAPAQWNPILNAIKGGVTNAQQNIQTLVNQAASNNGAPTADNIYALISGLDSQIDNVINLCVNALGPLTFGVSNLVGDVILGPVIQSINNGAEVVLSNVVGGGFDLVTQQVIQLFVHTLNRAVDVGKQNNVKNVANLEVTVQKLDNISKAAAVKPKPAAQQATRATNRH